MKILQDIIREEFGKRSIENIALPEYFATSLNPMLKLRPYQKECFQYFLTYWQNSFDLKEPKPHLLFHMATGSGKTLIMAGIMLYLYEQGYRNFLFFVDSSNIIEKTKDNFLNISSAKYLFNQSIQIANKLVEIRLVDNFQASDENCINLCLDTIQGLHSNLNTPKENAITYDDFAGKKIVLISDEAHHINSSTKKGKKVADVGSLFADDEFDPSRDWETTVMRIFNSNDANVLLEFTATEDFTDANIADKYENKVIFDYHLKKFREDGYSKDISVVQSDMLPIDRAIQCVLLSQYKRKLFSSIRQDIKPVMMLKSKTIKDNKDFYDKFVEAIKNLTVDDLYRIKSRAKDDVLAVFTYLDEYKIQLENLLLEIKEDFKEENLLLVDGNNISPDKQIKLNTLEAKDNEFRVVFAVDMLNEGWDVLNLFDIVRLYETRDARDGKPGKTTMQEAQLIGRGARYMPFRASDGSMPVGCRKFDNDIDNRLRAVETLHYHSAQNPKYIQELHTALVQTGIVAEKTREVPLILKDSFKRTRLYKDGYVFTNEPESYLMNEEITSLGEHILSQVYKVRIRSGEMKTSLVFGKATGEEISSLKFIPMKMKDLGCHIVRCAINTFEEFKFDALSETFPNLKSIKEFIESDDYLAGVSVSIYGTDEALSNLSQKDKLFCAIEVLKQIEPLMAKGGIGVRGSKRFTPKQIKDTFKDHKLKVALDDSDREYGKSMAEAANLFLRMDLEKCVWHAYNDCYGTSEEKHLIKYIEAIYPKLKVKYDEVYLVRNEKDLKVYSFKSGKAFEPDYVMFLRKKDSDGKFDNIQIFIEPKGQHLRSNDSWKEDCMKEIRDMASIHFSTQADKFNIWGMPFYTEAFWDTFDRVFQGEFLG